MGLLAAERAADLQAVGRDGRRRRLLPLEELELEVPVLLLLEVASLPLGLPSNLALLRPHVLTLTLDRARETTLLSGGRTRQERHDHDGEQPSHLSIVALILPRSR
jgi:hypothetical protein